MSKTKERGEYRSWDQIREAYAIERELADRLRHASRQERRELYGPIYDEFYRRVPLTPVLTRKSSPVETARAVAGQMRLLRRFLSRETTFLEIGPGDCALAFEVARVVKAVYAVDVSEEVTGKAPPPQNFQLVLSDGCSIPVSAGSVNVVYSNQLVEHLHPEDVREQLRNVYSALAPRGVYICITPNRLYGPSDISMYFDPVATGFHLKEYTTTEMGRLFEMAGFTEVRAYVRSMWGYIRLPLLPIRLLEGLLGRLPESTRRWLARWRPARLLLFALLGIRIVGTK